ncbi:MOSC domain-containing protein [Patescibacteria group bacterium]|nr:MAG: MOSC domain-containing protein [Patescibacteria group bacterium]
MSVSVHEDVAVGQLTNDEADDFFSTVVGKPARLVRTSPTDPRYVSEAFRRQGYVNRQPFADGYPILLTNEASLRSLHYRNGLMHGSVPMARFRPNISVDGIGTTFHEDTWQEITIGDDPTRGVALAIVSPCKRCRVPNIEQSGERAGQKSEINVLKDFLSSRQGTDSTDPNRRKGRFFGQNALISYGAVGKIISIGDAVQIVATGEPNADISSSDVSQ